MKKDRRKIRDLLINPKFQLSVIKYFAGLFLLTAAVNIGSVVYFFYKFKEKGIDVGLSPDHVFFRFIAEQESSMYFLMGGALLVALVILLLGGFFLSHRVAGPLYRLTIHMKDFANSDEKLKEVQFRKGDYFPEIEDEFNRMVKKQTS